MISVRRRAQLGLLATFIVLAASLATLVIMPRRSRPVAVADVGTVAPDFQLQDVDGRGVRLAQHRGQHAVVLFFGSVDCPRTADYNGRVQQLAQQYVSDARVKFYAIDISSRAQPIDRQLLRLDPKVAQRGFPTLIDDHGAVARRYSALATPTFVVLDAHGVVRYRGPFDNNADVAFATHAFCAEALGDVLGSPTSAVASFLRP